MKKVMDNIKPLMGMMQGKGQMGEDMIKNLMPGIKQNSQFKPQGNLLKGFKPKKTK
jgi:hypothetical protein